MIIAWSPLSHQEWPSEDHKRPPLPKVNHDDNTPDRVQVREGRDRVVRHMQQLVENRSHSIPDLQNSDQNGGRKIPDALWRGKATSTDPPASPAKTSYGNNKLFPIPPQHRDCDLKGKKDALSAISRASTQECKDLIRNVTCMQKADLLYNTDLRKECGVKTSGRSLVPLKEDTGGPTARIVFLFSLHGRAFRQVKRLFKAIYHTDHYYFVHVDSVSCCVRDSVHWKASCVHVFVCYKQCKKP